MSWGTELWDQFDNIAIHTQKGIDFCEKYGHFIKERSAIEKEYATKLKKLVRNYQPKKKEEEDYQFTVATGFLGMINEINDIAGQHETIAENLNVQTFDIQNLLGELKSERKRHLQDGAKQVNVLQAQLNQHERSKKQYEKAFKDTEKAQEAYKKADADINLSRAEVEKARSTLTTKQQTCEECKNEYAAELQKTNECQNGHYSTSMPEIFQKLQDMDERRIGRIQDFMRSSADIERSVIPIINTCIDGIKKSADTIDSTKDSRIVIERYKSGLQPPSDIPFEDLSDRGSGSEIHNHTPSNRAHRSDTIKGTVSGGKGKKRQNLIATLFSSSKTDDSKEDYSHLPPNQQKRKLHQKIEGLVQSVAKETAERDALLKMRDVYVQNPALGDASSLDKQLEENAHKLDKLRQELQKYEGYLIAAEGGGGYMAEADGRLNAQSQGLSVSDDSITRSMSQVSVGSNSNRQQTHQPTQKDSPDSGVDNNRESFAEQDSFDDGLNNCGDDLDDYTDFPVIGMAKALYYFDANNEGSIAMDEGEEFSILEQDQGDGWTRVRNKAHEEGFVPTSYVELTFY